MWKLSNFELICGCTFVYYLFIERLGHKNSPRKNMVIKRLTSRFNVKCVNRWPVSWIYSQYNANNTYCRNTHASISYFSFAFLFIFIFLCEVRRTMTSHEFPIFDIWIEIDGCRHEWLRFLSIISLYSIINNYLCNGHISDGTQIRPKNKNGSLTSWNIHVQPIFYRLFFPQR